MPAFITIPNPQPYPPVTIPQMAPGIQAYMWGLRNDYRYGVGVVIPEQLVQASASLEFAVPSYAGSNENSPAIQWVTQYAGAPATVEVHLEGTLDILNGPWFQLAKSTVVTGDSQTVNLGTSKVAAIRTRNVTVTAPATPGAIASVAAASGGSTVYTANTTFTGGGSNGLAGYYITVAGLDLSANNGTFLCTASTSSTITLSNPNGVVDTHAGTTVLVPTVVSIAEI
jgi:hypothetical protein